MINEELIGKYNFINIPNNKAEDFKLNINIDKDGKLNFLLKSVIAGTFGSVGTDWHGICIINKNSIILKCSRIVDWKFTFLEEEKEEIENKCTRTFPCKINIQDNNIKLSIKFKNRIIHLQKKPK